MFLIIILILSLSSLYELCKNKSCKGDFYFIIVFLLTLILSFRYAQGTDYFNYLSMYQSIDAGSSFFENTLYHGEIGWYMLSLLWKKMGLSFDVFIIIISIVMMSAIYRALKMSPYKMTGLLLLFPTYYLTYCFSALRQGLCVCLFLGFGLKLLFERKYLRYYLLVLAMCLIHTASAILLLAPMIIKRIKVHYPLLMVFVALLLSTMISRIPLLQQVSAISSYLDLDIGIGSIAMRLILFLIVLHLHRLGHPYDTPLYREEIILVRLYYAGFIIFCMTSFSGLISQRMTVPFKAIEIILIPLLIYRNRKILYCQLKPKFQYLAVYFLSVIVLMNVECVKNLNAFIDQQEYYSWVTPLNYPYMSIFDKTELGKYTKRIGE